MLWCEYLQSYFLKRLITWIKVRKAEFLWCTIMIFYWFFNKNKSKQLWSKSTYDETSNNIWEIYISYGWRTPRNSSCADWPMALVNMRWCSSQTNFFQTTRSCYHKEIVYPHGALKFSRYMIWQNRSLQQLNFVRTFVWIAESLIYTCWHIHTNL